MTIMTILIGIILFVAALASIWFWIKTLMVIFRDNTLMGVLAIFFSPIVQIIWYFSNKEKLSENERKDFKWLFITYALLFVLGFIFGLVYAAAMSTAYSAAPTAY